MYLYEDDDDDEARRGTKARSDDVTAKCVPYARRVALTGAERFRTWICRALREGKMG